MEKCFNYPCPLLSAHQGPHWRPAKLSRSCRFPAPPQNKWTKALKESSLWHGQQKDWCTQTQYFIPRHVWVSHSFSEYCFSFKWFNDNKFWILLVCSRSPKPSGGLNYFPYEKPSLSSQPTFPFTLWGFFVGFLLGGFVCFGFFKKWPIWIYRCFVWITEHFEIWGTFDPFSPYSRNGQKPWGAFSLPPANLNAKSSPASLLLENIPFQFIYQ